MEEPLYIKAVDSTDLLKVEDLPEVKCEESCEFDLEKTLELSGLKDYGYKFYDGDIPCLGGKLTFRTQKELDNEQNK